MRTTPRTDTTTTTEKESTTLTTPTKTKTYAESVDAANSDAAERAEATREAIKEARLAQPELDLAADLAEVAEDEVRAQWRAGNAELPALALAEAQGEAVKARELAAGAKGRLDKMERQRPNTDLSLGLVVAGVLADHVIPGIAIRVASVKVVERPRKTELPVVLAVQNRPTELRADGSITGEVDLTYWHNPDIHRELTADQIETAAGLAGMYWAATLYPSEDGAQRVRVKVQHGHTGTPSIATVTPLAVASLGQRVAQDAASAVIYEGKSLRGMHGGVYEGSHLRATLIGVELASETVEDGQRTTVIAVRIGVEEQRQEPGKSAPRAIEDRLSDYTGMFVSGIGMCQSVQVRPLATPAHAIGREAVFTVVSSVVGRRGWPGARELGWERAPGKAQGNDHSDLKPWQDLACYDMAVPGAAVSGSYPHPAVAARIAA